MELPEWNHSHTEMAHGVEELRVEILHHKIDRYHNISISTETPPTWMVNYIPSPTTST